MVTIKIATKKSLFARSWRRLQMPRAQKLFMGALIAVMLTGLLTFFPSASPTQAAPPSTPSNVALPLAAGNPGVPSDPATVFTEDFQNRTDGSNILLTDYRGVDRQRYTASPYWRSRTNCNGFIIDGSSTQNRGDCTAKGTGVSAFRDLKTLLNAIGQLNNSPRPGDNAGVASFTEGNVPRGDSQIQFETTTPLSLSQASRFVTFSVDAAAMSCDASGATPPQLGFSLVNADGREMPVSSDPIDACNDPRAKNYGTRNAPVKAGTFAADGSVLITSESFRIRMKNENISGDGNDGAFDNIKVLDATPQLDKSFKDARVPAGGTTTLTFTVTNTSELASKNGWKFTDNLPTGLVVANNPNVKTTCTNGTMPATAGQGALTVGGNLDKGQTSCTFSVDVTSATPGAADSSPKTYQNCSANLVDVRGLNAPNCAQVQFFTEPKLAVTKTASKQTLRQGDPVTYTVTMKNSGTGNFTAANPARMSDDLSKVLDDATLTTSGTGAPTARYITPNATASPPQLNGTNMTWAGALAVGQSIEFTYTVTTNNNGDGAMPNNACGIANNQPNQCATVTLNLPRLTVSKSADKTVVNNDGDILTYTVRLTNPGPGSFTSGMPASVQDDLSQVLDDADMVAGSLTATYANPGGGATAPTYSAANQKLNWSGALAAGQSVDLKYQVKYANKPTGNKELKNQACIPAQDTRKGTNSCAVVTVGASNISDSKSLQGKTDSDYVNAGDVLTYQVEFKNTGKAAGPVNREDNLSRVLDDATLATANGSPELIFSPANSGLSASYVDNAGGKRIVVTGTIQPNATVTLSYRVTVNPVTQRGDNVLANFLVNPGQKPPTSCAADNEDCTTNPVSGELSWNKVDDKNVKLAGSEWSLTDAQGNVVAIVDNGGNDADSIAGALRAKNLKWGTYKLVETKAPNGYLGSPQERTVTVNATTINVSAGNVVNRLLTITLEKYGYPTTGQAQPSLIDGSAFTLNADNGGQVGAPVGTITPTGTGTFQVTGITTGRYWLQETKAPDGHNLLARAIALDISQNSSGALVLTSPEVSGVVELQQNPATIKVYDNRAITLPIAGGSGTVIFMMTGLALAALAVALTLYFRRKRA